MIWQNRGPARRVLRDFVIIAHSFPFVNRFLKSFFRNFSQPFASGGSARLLYHTLSLLSRGFSKVFSTFFAIFRLAVLQPAFCAPLFHSLHIIALSFSFVKHFLTSFSGLAQKARLYKTPTKLLCKLHSLLVLRPKFPPSIRLYRKVIRRF